MGLPARARWGPLSTNQPTLSSPLPPTLPQVKGAEKVLYGLDDIAGCSEIIIVEGEMDKLSLEEAGFRNVVSVSACCRAGGCLHVMRDQPPAVCATHGNPPGCAWPGAPACLPHPSPCCDAPHARLLPAQVPDGAPARVKEGEVPPADQVHWRSSAANACAAGLARAYAWPCSKTWPALQHSVIPS